MSFSKARMRENDALNRCESSGIRVGEEAVHNNNQSGCVRGSSERSTAIIVLRAPSGAKDPLRTVLCCHTVVNLFNCILKMRPAASADKKTLKTQEAEMNRIY